MSSIALNLKHNFAGKLGVAAVFATAAAVMLTGCSSAVQEIGSAAESPGLKGDVSLTQVFNGGPQQESTVISAAALEAGGSYAGTGAVTINGDVPDNVSIEIDDGKLTINGDVGAQAQIDVELPVVTHPESYQYSCYTTGFGFKSDGTYGFGANVFVPNGCTGTTDVVDWLRYNDSAPGVTVTGHADNSAKISSNGAIRVGGQLVANKNQLGPVPG